MGAGAGVRPPIAPSRVNTRGRHPAPSTILSGQGGNGACLPTSIGVGVHLVAAGWGGRPGRERTQCEAAGNATVTRS